MNTYWDDLFTIIKIISFYVPADLTRIYWFVKYRLGLSQVFMTFRQLEEKMVQYIKWKWSLFMYQKMFYVYVLFYSCQY